MFAGQLVFTTNTGFILDGADTPIVVAAIGVSTRAGKCDDAATKTPAKEKRIG